MVRGVLQLLKEVEPSSEMLRAAKGKYKFPESWKEFKNYIKLR
jgi:hypothetical protein